MKLSPELKKEVINEMVKTVREYDNYVPGNRIFALLVINNAESFREELEKNINFKKGETLEDLQDKNLLYTSVYWAGFFREMIRQLKPELAQLLTQEELDDWNEKKEIKFIIETFKIIDRETGEMLFEGTHNEAAIEFQEQYQDYDKVKIIDIDGNEYRVEEDIPGKPFLEKGDEETYLTERRKGIKQ